MCHLKTPPWSTELIEYLGHFMSTQDAGCDCCAQLYWARGNGSPLGCLILIGKLIETHSIPPGEPGWENQQESSKTQEFDGKNHRKSHAVCAVCSHRDGLDLQMFPPRHRDIWEFLFMLLLLFSRQVVSDSLWPLGLQHARPPCSAVSWSLPKFMSIELVMLSNHLYSWAILN